MKKIFIACSKWNYPYIERVQNRLEQLGYEVILPNCIEDPFIEERIKKEQSTLEHVEFFKKSFLESIKKSKESDAILVLNMDKVQEEKCYPNYIGGATFLEMYDSYLLNHPIYLYHDIPEGMLSDEIEGMGSIALKGELFDLLKYDDHSTISKENHLLNYFTYDDLWQLKECKDEYLKASVIVRRLFQRKQDKAGEPYIGHLKRVSDRLVGNVQIAGLLHDTVEDTEITCKDLLELDFNYDVLEIMFTVTKEKRDTSHMTKLEKLDLYDQEINDVIRSRKKEASLLKEADMSDNYNPERLSKLPIEKQEWFQKKYEKQLVKLRKVNEERNQKLC